ALEKPFVVIELLDARVGVCQLVVGRCVSRINRQLFLEFSNRFGDPRLEQIELTQKKMGQRKLGIKRNSFLRVLFSDWIKLLTKQHASGKQIARCTFRRDVEHLGERSEERRVGKECRDGGSSYHLKKRI